MWFYCFQKKQFIKGVIWEDFPLTKDILPWCAAHPPSPTSCASSLFRIYVDCLANSCPLATIGGGHLKGKRVLRWGFPSAPRMPGPVRKDTSGGRRECRGLAQGPGCLGLSCSWMKYHFILVSFGACYHVRNTKLDRSFGLILGLKKYHCRFKECLQTWSSSAVTTPQT